MHFRILAGFLGWMAALTMLEARAALPAFDFRQASDAAEWRPLHDLRGLEGTPAGLVVRIGGNDPYFVGPVRDYPAGMALWMNLRIRSDTGGTCQVFYFRDGTVPTETDSVRFPVPAGEWFDARVPVRALGPGHRLRVDPPGEAGSSTLERLWFDERVFFPGPEWPVPPAPESSEADPAIRSGEVRLGHNRTQFGGFVVEVAGRRLAFGQIRPLLGYLVGREVRWWEFARGASPAVALEKDALVVSLAATDPDGARWNVRQVFAAGAQPGTVGVDTTVTVDRPRSLIYFPPLTLVVGAGGVGTRKQQAILAGVEYLDDEPSSSEADLTGPQAARQVPDTARLTFPLAVIVAEARYLGLTWEMQPATAVVFDSPDRLFRSGGHLLGLLVPGSNGINREESSLIPYDGLALTADTPLRVRAEILGGRGGDAVAAVQHYVRLRGLPAVPDTGSTPEEYFRLAARGWLDSAIREGDLYRHAAPGGFRPMPAADAAFDMDWLAGRLDDVALAGRLRRTAAAAIAQVPAGRRGQQQVGHVRLPVAPLVYGGVPESVDAARQVGRGLLARFTAEGTVPYRAAGGGLDYARTHWTNEANGLTAQVVQSVLESALFAGDRGLAEAGLRHLRALTKFRGTVPRGAQTWEIPLHTPDILAAAHLVHAYTLGFELTGDPELLGEARYWAWTGVPFVYLHPPTDRPVGLYATTPVLGATQWVAPNWIGLPVQWCGLVYGEAVARLARHDPSGPWRRLAEGIVASGIQQTYPATDGQYAGLLPDSFSLKAQQRNAANINPGTLLAGASRFRLAGSPPLYDYWCFRGHGVVVHAAGGVDDVREDAAGFAFRVTGWPVTPHRILIQGVRGSPRVRLNGRETPLAAPHVFEPEQERLMIEAGGTVTIEVRMAR